MDGVYAPGRPVCLPHAWHRGLLFWPAAIHRPADLKTENALMLGTSLHGTKVIVSFNWKSLLMQFAY